LSILSSQSRRNDHSSLFRWSEVNGTCRCANHYGTGILFFGGGSFLLLIWAPILQGHSSSFRARGQPLITAPLSGVTTSGMAKGQESSVASALFYMMRNIGGSIGIAALSRLLSVRERFHSERIGESVTIYSTAVQERMQQSAAFVLSQGSDSYSANMRAIGAIGAIGGAVRREAFLLVCIDCFLVLGCVLLASVAALFLIKRPQFRA
jgi:MFS transporter, DHA2 family, multidrug resistance protein